MLMKHLTSKNIAFSFYVYNWYRLSLGISYEYGCTESAFEIKTENVSMTTITGTNNSTNEFEKTGNNSEWEVNLGKLLLFMICSVPIFY